MLSKVYERGIGAYKTNPQSVRPSVSSPEQWAARVNGFLFAVRNGKFRSVNMTLIYCQMVTLKTEEERQMTDRHIKNVQETDDSYIIEFGKSDMPEMTVEAGYNEEEKEERFDRSLLSFRASDAEMVDEEDRRVRMSLSSEEPVERSFGMEVLGHTDDEIDLSRMNSGNAPLLLDHDMTKQIGVVERTYLDEADRRLRAVVRFGKSALAGKSMMTSRTVSDRTYRSDTRLKIWKK